MLPRKSARRGQPLGSSVEKLSQVAPLPLDASHVANVGPVRAALDAVKVHPLAYQAFEEARGNPAAMETYVCVSSRLARLTAEAAAAPAVQRQHRPAL